MDRSRGAQPGSAEAGLKAEVSGCVVAGSVVLAAVPAVAQADSNARFIHAVPGAGPAELDIVADGQSRRLAGAGFANLSRYERIGSGPVRFVLKDGNGKTLANRRYAVEDRRSYTVAAVPVGDGVALRVYPDAGSAQSGSARVRVVHLSPELGSPDISLDGRVVARTLDFTEATDYLTTDPGEHDLAALKPDGQPVLSADNATLPAGKAISAMVLGSRGMRTRLVLGQDGASQAGRDEGGIAGARAESTSGGGTETWTVKPGDSLWRIAETQLGSGASLAQVDHLKDRLWNANAQRIGTGDPDLIYPGQKLQMPA